MASLATYHVQQMERLGSDFFEDGDGQRAVARRTDAVDDIVRGRFDEHFGAEGGDIAAIAVGGYGRRELFPQSDVDLLLLFGKARDAHQRKDRIATLLTTLWDSRLRVSHSVRDPRDCTKLAPNNAELHISLLDARFVAGDEGFFEEFRRATLPKFYLREQKAIERMLAETARKRHASFDRTLYHLEPNVKEGPGGLRDYHLACWTAQLGHVRPDSIPLSEEYLPDQPGWDIRDAKRFLFAVRCYLHYYYGRDKNLLSYDMQDAIAHAGAEKVYAGERGVADLMRSYFRNTRLMYRLALRLMDESSTPSNAMLKILRRRKSRLSNRYFDVMRGRVYLRDPLALEARPDLSLEVFEFQARHGLPLAAQTETRLRERLQAIRSHFDSGPKAWPRLRLILSLPHAFLALDAMRESGVLYTLIPEFELIDCLVIRNFYHRYTVDEHTLVTIRILKDLSKATETVDKRYTGLLAEVDRADLLYLALLLHDIGKGVQGESHVRASAELAEPAMLRLGVDDPEDRETVSYLVRDHSAMSDVMTKRDLSDNDVLEGFMGRVKTLERLKLLTLMTYADSSAVDPTAKTVWRKDLLWRLYLGVYAVFQRDHGDRRIQPEVKDDCLDLASSDAERQRMTAFLRGFPERYLRTHAARQVYDHFLLAEGLGPGKATAVCKRAASHWDAVVLAADRPFLFASLCAAIAGRGFNIEQAEAFSNDAGLALDSFRVSVAQSVAPTDVDASDPARLERLLRRVGEGGVEAAELVGSHRERRYRRRGEARPRVSVDNQTSSKATIFYVHATDRSRLLYDLASVFSQHGCDIDLVLCETQGHLVSDVFYVRQGSAKIPAEACGLLKDELVLACDEAHSTP